MNENDDFQNPSHIFKHGLVGNIQVLHQSKLGFVPKHSTPLLLHILEIYKQTKEYDQKKKIIMKIKPRSLGVNNP